MKIILFSRRGLAFQAEELQTLREVIAEFGFDYAVNEEFAEILKELIGWEIPSSQRYGAHIATEDQEAVLVCYGGDGTLLEGVHRLHNKNTIVAGINFGHLGFLTTATREGVEPLFEDIAMDRLHIHPRTMLQIEGINQCDEVVTALNWVSGWSK